MADLPDLESFAPDEESRALIRERLGLTRSEAVDAVEAFDDDDLELDLADDILDLRRGIEGDERDGR